MSLSPGTRLGPYEILGTLGAGGMGEVYRARDVKLARDVAIKVLPPAFALEPERVRRFEREARVLAALNHPHIAAIHGFEESDHIRGLVLELVEGPTLADRLASGPLSVVEALNIARQLTEALEAAHESGITHRDLKPANIKLKARGAPPPRAEDRHVERSLAAADLSDCTVKVLDFGLAKEFATEGSGSGRPHLPTSTVEATREGMIMGTPAYMSPEQARGQAVDKRTDIWAFGCVLFEMLTGRVPYSGATISDTIAAILEREPQWKMLPAETPASIRRLLSRCLEKDAGRRLRDVADARIEIDDALRPGRDGPAELSTLEGLQDSPGGFPQWVPWLVAFLAVAASIVLLFVKPAARPDSPPPSNVQVQRLTDLVGLEEAPAISPDGKMVAFVATDGGKRQVWVRLLAGGTPLAVTKDDVDHYGPRWSSDSGSLVYFTPGVQPGDEGTMWEIPALGGPGRPLVKAVAAGDLSHDGTRLAFLRFDRGVVELATANRDGSNIQGIAKLTAASYVLVRWSPDDRRIALLQDAGGARFTSDLLVVDVSGGTVRRITHNAYGQGFTWAQDGSRLIVSSAQGSMMAYPPTFNLWVVPLDGGPLSQLTFGEASYEFPDLGAQGNLVVSRVHAQSDVWRFPVTNDPAENARRGERITRQTGAVQTVSVSADESQVTFLSDNLGHSNVWTARVADGEMRPVTREFDPNVVIAVPIWSPRGDWINFLTNRNSRTPDVTLWVVKPDGSDLRNLGAVGAWACWSGDGEWLYFSSLENDVYQIKKVSVAGGQQFPVRDDNGIGCQAAPDGSLYYAKILTQAGGAWDFEIRRAKPETGPSEVLGRVAGARVPTTPVNFHAFISPDGRQLAVPLLDGSTTNLWALSTTGGEWRKLVDFGRRSVMIARRIDWSRDGRSIYASVSDVDSDIVMMVGLRY